MMDESELPWPIPAEIDYALKTPSSSGFLVAAWTSLAFAVLQFPWMCGVSRPVFDYFHGSYWPNDRHNFIIGRIVDIAPALLALIIGGLAFVSRRVGSHRVIAGTGVILAMLGLYLFPTPW